MAEKLAHRSFTVKDAEMWDVRCDRVMRAGDAHALEFAETWMFLMEGFINCAVRHRYFNAAGGALGVLMREAEICRLAARGAVQDNASFAWAVREITEHWAYGDAFKAWVVENFGTQFYGSAP